MKDTTVQTAAFMLFTKAASRLFFFLLLAAFGPRALGQYSIDWFKVAGGSATSTGSVYTVSDTVGQPDAGPVMTNAQFSVTGGFWALPAVVQAPGAPTVSISPATPGNVTISWTPDTAGFVLQETWSMSPFAWTNSLTGSTNPITVPTTLPAKFYRLVKP